MPPVVGRRARRRLRQPHCSPPSALSCEMFSLTVLPFRAVGGRATADHHSRDQRAVAVAAGNVGPRVLFAMCHQRWRIADGSCALSAQPLSTKLRTAASGGIHCRRPCANGVRRTVLLRRTQRAESAAGRFVHENSTGACLLTSLECFAAASSDAVWAGLNSS